MTRPPRSRADALFACLLAGSALLLYGSTAYPTLAGTDSAELAGAAWTWGVPHAPGYPLYTLLTGAFQHGFGLVFAAEPARLANLASAAYGAAAIGLLFLLGRRLRLTRAASAAAALTLLGSTTFWSQANVAEVYTLDALLLVAVLHSLASRAPAGGQAGLLVGLWVGHRVTNLLLLPMLLGCRGEDRQSGGRRLRFAGAFVLSLLVYL